METKPDDGICPDLSLKPFAFKLCWFVESEDRRAALHGPVQVSILCYGTDIKMLIFTFHNFFLQHIFDLHPKMQQPQRRSRCLPVSIRARRVERLILISAEPASPQPMFSCKLPAHWVLIDVAQAVMDSTGRGERMNQLNAISSALVLPVNVNYTGLPQPGLSIPECLEASSVQKLQEPGQHLHRGRDIPVLEPRLNNQDKQDGVGGPREAVISTGA